uniref:VWFC domain-containing protein n=1 Tax=Heliothis virescens TaxID=7102 RepID=A0A2A4JKY7_HELVI
MQGGVIGGICLLAFLLSKGRAENFDSFKSLSDVENKQTQSDLRSGRQSSDDGFLAAPFNPFNEELGPYPPLGPGRGYPNNPEQNSYPYSPGLQAQPELNNRIYQPGYSGSPNLSPYNQGSNLPQFPAQGDRESYQRMLEPISLNSQPVPRTSAGTELSYFSSTYPYKPRLGTRQIKSEDNGEPYQAVPLPDPSYSRYDSLMVPYIEPKSTKTDSQTYQSAIARYESNLKLNRGQNFAQSLYNTHEKKQYQTVPLLSDDNPKSYEYSLVPYKEPNSPVIQKPQQEQTISKQYGDGSNEASLVSSSYSSALKTNPTQEDIDSYESDREPSDKQTISNIKKETEKSVARQFIPSSLEMKFDPLSSSYSNENNPEVDDTDTSPDVEPKRAETAKVYAAVRPASSAVPYTYTPGQRPYVIDYPPESLYQARPSNEPQSLPNVVTNAKSRVISPYEYVFPNQISGGENIVQCKKENEFHHFWSKAQDCLVCICLNDYGLLSPVCASCGGCNNPAPDLPEPIPPLPESITVQPATPEPPEPSKPQVPPVGPELDPVPTPAPYPLYPEPLASPSPGPEIVPEPIPTLPTPTPAASCAPLPNGEPFPNPLHPCQICVCKESSLSGSPDVQIECKEDPQCTPIPDVPMPIPLPMCEKFPENVLFPHPTESCKLCKCAKSVSEAGLPEQQLTCYPHPDCIPKLEPITEPAPPLPIPIEPQNLPPVPVPAPEPVEPEKETSTPVQLVPLPEIVTAEPLPWPPITTVAPITTPGPPAQSLSRRPGPLPGPSPHESCLPYPPNQMFQHPWDECQVCMCSEAVAAGVTNVEVNCYTKPSCCIEPPDAVKKASCAPLPNGEPFPNPLHPCQICVCKESSLSGSPDVQIECKEDPQCTPIPDVPMPIPLPMCEKFPENVLFPHPTESCKLCKCAKSVSEAGLPEQQLTCYPHPDCIPKLEPITEPAPPLPIPIEPQNLPPVPVPAPEPVEPEKETSTPVQLVPLPEIVTAEPLPWPPITTVAPITTPGPPAQSLSRRPGPLPGPSPHESCLPYPPNQMFQHPWDECQVCMCSEAVAAGVTNVEVNCYTKPSCCIEPPDAVKKGFNLPYPGLGNAADSPDVPPGPQTGVISSTYKPPSTYISYTPRPVSTYPSNKAVVETLAPPGFSSQSYPIIPETGFGDPTSSYPYQPNYPSPYVNQQYPEYPPRLPQPASSYKPSSFVYPPNYQYGQGGYKYDPRFSVVSSPNVYPPMYGYDIPPGYPPGKGVSSYPQTPASGPTALISKCQRGQTPYHLMPLNEMEDLAQFGDGEHRGPNWYDYSENSVEHASVLEEDQESSSLEFSKYDESSSDTSSASAKETSERKRATKLYRTCTPCPHDMLKRYTNIGIKWLCGAYQRARRSFKSDCMMRYRNCQDGTMFIKIHDHKCKNDSFHGRSWFYVYGV